MAFLTEVKEWTLLLKNMYVELQAVAAGSLVNLATILYLNSIRICIRVNIIFIPIVYHIIRFSPRRSSIGSFSPSVTVSVKIRQPQSKPKTQNPTQHHQPITPKRTAHRIEPSTEPNPRNKPPPPPNQKPQTPNQKPQIGTKVYEVGEVSVAVFVFEVADEEEEELGS
ncbi:hypothetical protein Dsin_016596 [Dipteronia sinensis]|uniref:Uncharacterized protein n=1 Tax=Dipteronia sinensis TaxID=43782 RepID=A0AAE0ADD9_9ROSI|nr:hypothetical protein Dsin_016596 [Dipteronia sinensis]